MPQEFDQAQSASEGQEVGDIVESAGVQVDGTTDALDAVLDDIQSVLESNAEEYVGSFVQRRRMMPQLRDSGNHSSSPLDAGTLREVHSFAVFSALKPNTASV